LFVWRLEDGNDDQSLILEEANDASSRHLGVATDALMGCKIGDRMPHMRRAERVKLLAEVARTGVPHRHSPARFDAWSGKLWWQSVYVPLSGRRVAVLFEDVTARVTLEKSHEFQSALLDAVEQAVVATDVEGRITYWNRFAESLYGWSAAEAMGRIIGELVVPAGLEDSSAKIAQTVAAGATWAGALPVLRKNGEVITAYVALSPIWRDGAGAGIISISHDMSAQIEAEEVLRRS